MYCSMYCSMYRSMYRSVYLYCCRILTLFMMWGRHPLGPSNTMGDSGTRQTSTSPEAIVAAKKRDQTSTRKRTSFGKRPLSAGRWSPISHAELGNKKLTVSSRAMGAICRDRPKNQIDAVQAGQSAPWEREHMRFTQSTSVVSPSQGCTHTSYVALIGLPYAAM